MTALLSCIRDFAHNSKNSSLFSGLVSFCPSFPVARNRNKFETDMSHLGDFFFFLSYWGEIGFII